MASSHLHSFLLLTFLFIATSLIQAQARESRFFSKNTPYDQPIQGEDQQQQQKQEERIDFTPLSAFKKNSPSQENQSGHGLYSHEPTQFSLTTTTATINPETQSAHLDLTSFREAANEYNSFTRKDLNSGFSGYGMSDTRLFENGKYFYDVQKDGYQNGFPYNRETSGSGFHEYPTENRYGGYGNDNRYGEYENRYGGYNDNYQNRYRGYIGNENRFGGYGHNQNGYYQSNYYNQEEQDMFVP